MHYRKMTKNYIFRKFECGLSKEETAKLCFKSVRTVSLWDGGKPIPPECRRLMRLFKSRVLCDTAEWEGFSICSNKMRLPTGQLVTPQELLTGIALLQIQSIDEIKVLSKILKFSRILSRT
ncbi:regulator [Vibrio fluvialis]|nr:regulator [Vibrio fluvialis]